MKDLEKLIVLQQEQLRSRDLEGFLQDASDLEMRRASAAGDVCCMLMLKYKYPKSFLISFYFPIVCGMHNKLLK